MLARDHPSLHAPQSSPNQVLSAASSVIIQEINLLILRQLSALRHYHPNRTATRDSSQNFSHFEVFNQYHTIQNMLIFFLSLR
jgi:hypothetical protein